MAKCIMDLKFKGFELYAKRLEELGGNVQETAEKALIKSKEHINPKLHKIMDKHHRTGDTEGSIDESTDVKWSGTMGKLPVGFNIESGGLPSIFLMYGTPKMKKDQALFNALFGSRTKKEVSEIQQEVFNEEILKHMGG